MEVQTFHLKLKRSGTIRTPRIILKNCDCIEHEKFVYLQLVEIYTVVRKYFHAKATLCADQCRRNTLCPRRQQDGQAEFSLNYQDTQNNIEEL